MKESELTSPTQDPSGKQLKEKKRRKEEKKYVSKKERKKETEKDR
jgi:hypothetical protein